MDAAVGFVFGFGIGFFLGTKVLFIKYIPTAKTQVEDLYPKKDHDGHNDN